MEAMVQPASGKGTCPGSQKLLTSADQKERLSLVYVNALAARAEFTTSEPDLDRDGIDLPIQAGGRSAQLLTCKVTPEELMLRQRSCWLSLQGGEYGEVTNKATVPFTSLGPTY